MTPDHQDIERAIEHLDKLGLSHEANIMRYLAQQLRFAHQGNPRHGR